MILENAYSKIKTPFLSTGYTQKPFVDGPARRPYHRAMNRIIWCSVIPYCGGYLGLIAGISIFGTSRGEIVKQLIEMSYHETKTA